MEANGFSAPISIRLFVAGETIEVAKTGPDRITLAEPRILPAGPAELEFIINGVSERTAIILQTVADGQSRFVPYVDPARPRVARARATA